MLVQSWRNWLRSEPIDAAQNVDEESVKYRDFGQLECDIAPVRHLLGADLEQLLVQSRQRTLLHGLR